MRWGRRYRSKGLMSWTVAIVWSVDTRVGVADRNPNALMGKRQKIRILDADNGERNILD